MLVRGPYLDRIGRHAISLDLLVHAFKLFQKAGHWVALKFREGECRALASEDRLDILIEEEVNALEPRLGLLSS